MNAKHARRRNPAPVRKALSLFVAAVALTLGATAPAMAVNADGARAPKAAEVATYPLKANSVGAGQISPNSVGWEELGTYPRQAIRDLQGPINANLRLMPDTITPNLLMDDAKAQVMTVASLDAPKAIVNIGGPINTQGTKLGLGMKLKRGTYLVTVSGQINRTDTAATPDKQTQPQLSLWLDKNADGAFTWQTEGSISPNATIPDLKDRSVTVSGQAVVKVTASTWDVDLVAHGYNNDQSAAGSGELSVGSALITAIPIAD